MPISSKKWLVIIPLFIGVVAAGSDTRPSPPPLGKLIDVGGYRVHLYCLGAGSPTVVVVGGAFSFDWGLVQPAVATLTRVCTYDPSGTAWSDSYQNQENSTPPCVERVTEIHSLLKEAKIEGPYVLVGFSIGGLTGRLYTAHHPDEVAGMVIVDHAFLGVGSDAAPVSAVSGKTTEPKSRAGGIAADSPPVLISSTPITLGLEDDKNFARLSQRDQDLHAWAMSKKPLRPTAETASECSNAVEDATRTNLFPLDDRPLIVIRTNNDSPGYGKLQDKLLRLSRNSKTIVAENSSHMVIIDEPELVVAAIREVVQAVKKGSRIN